MRHSGTIADAFGGSSAGALTSVVFQSLACDGPRTLRGARYVWRVLGCPTAAESQRATTYMGNVWRWLSRPSTVSYIW